MLYNPDIDAKAPVVDHSPITLPKDKTYADLQDAHENPKVRPAEETTSTPEEEALYPQSMVRRDVTRAIVDRFDKTTGDYDDLKKASIGADELANNFGIDTRNKEHAINKASNQAIEQFGVLNILRSEAPIPTDIDVAIENAYQSIYTQEPDPKSIQIIQLTANRILSGEYTTKLGSDFIHALGRQSSEKTPKAIREISIDTLKKITNRDTELPNNIIITSLRLLAEVKGEDLDIDASEILKHYLTQEFPSQELPEPERDFIRITRDIAIEAARNALQTKNPSNGQIDLCRTAAGMIADGDDGSIKRFLNDLLTPPSSGDNPRINNLKGLALLNIAESDKTLPETKSRAITWICENRSQLLTPSEIDLLTGYLDPIPSESSEAEIAIHKKIRNIAVNTIDDAIHSKDPNKSQRDLMVQSVSKITDGSASPDSALILSIKLIKSSKDRNNPVGRSFCIDSMRTIAESSQADVTTRLEVINQIAYLDKADFTIDDAKILEQFLEMTDEEDPLFRAKFLAIECVRMNSFMPNEAQLHLLGAAADRIIAGDLKVTELALKDFTSMAQSDRPEVAKIGRSIFEAWINGKPNQAITALGTDKIIRLSLGK